MGFGNYGVVESEAPNYKVIKDFGALGKETEGKSVKRLRLVSWNGKAPKFDIRPWKTTEDGEQCSKGITLSSEEIEHLYKLLQKIDSEEEAAETKE